jgi:hypothetical protein
VPADKRAHGEDKMTCQTCHTVMDDELRGCHLPIEANEKTERHHYEGGFTRNFATYNPQVARDDMFFIGRHGPVKGNKIAPVRSSSALVLSSTNSIAKRSISSSRPSAASGYSAQPGLCAALSAHRAQDRNQDLLGLPPVGRQRQQRDPGANPDARHRLHRFRRLQRVGGRGKEHRSRPGDRMGGAAGGDRQLPAALRLSGLVRCAPGARAEAAGGPRPWHGRARRLPAASRRVSLCRGRRGGMRVYDVASIANKGVSQRIISAPFSALGQDTHIPSRNATCVALPTTQPVAPAKNQGDLMRKVNLEQPMHPIYNYALITDAEEGLILVDVNTLQDGEPRNNFLTRALTWNGDGILQGARHITMGGSYAYITANAGVVIVNLQDPLKPVVAAVVPIKGARATALQLRYLAVTDDTGLRFIDVTIPERAKLVESAFVPLADAHRIHLARTYAYVAAGKEGLVIVDIENPEKPRVYMKFTADGTLDDVQDVTVASTNASAFAYVADGRNGLKVIQLTAPDTQPKFYGFSPDPKPQVIAWRQTQTPALSLSRALERDRAVDETGGQVAVFGRVGSRPLNLEEQRRMYLKPDGTPWTVRDRPESSQKAP